jgi:hypothetical protein
MREQNPMMCPATFQERYLWKGAKEPEREDNGQIFHSFGDEFFY